MARLCRDEYHAACACTGVLMAARLPVTDSCSNPFNSDIALRRYFRTRKEERFFPYGTAEVDSYYLTSEKIDAVRQQHNHVYQVYKYEMRI